MLSILIPVYNRDVTKLVGKLIKQCGRQKIFFQIIVIDDCSKEKFKLKNEIISTYFGVNYLELTENIGRAKIRNRLGKLAAYDYALFLDCDMMIPKDFIKTYLNIINDKRPEIVCGGIKVSTSRPKSKKKQLHWVYGNLREGRNAHYRNKNQILNFSSANFLVMSNVFVKNLFDDAIKGYGYEDVMWAQNISNKSINILHIDNPAIHLGIEETNIFLQKTEQALDNLSILHQNDKIEETRLLKVYKTLTKLKIQKFVFKIIWARRESILGNLNSPNPSMRKFDLWKLMTFLKRQTN